MSSNYEFICQSIQVNVSSLTLLIYFTKVADKFDMSTFYFYRKLPSNNRLSKKPKNSWIGLRSFWPKTVHNCQAPNVNVPIQNSVSKPWFYGIFLTVLYFVQNTHILNSLSSVISRYGILDRPVTKAIFILKPGGDSFPLIQQIIH